MDRRSFLLAGAAASIFAFLPRVGLAAFAPKPSGWRRFALTTEVDLPVRGGAADLWLPIPSVNEAGWQRPGESAWETTAESAEIVTDAESGARFLHATWGEGGGPRTLTLTSRVETRDRSTDFGAEASVAPLSADDRALYTASTDLIPTDGIVAETSEQIVKGIEGDEAKARAIYAWIVENTARNPETRGCGLGDIASMLRMGDLTGKCADLNALYVGLARAAGLPARDVYGLRVAPSAFGYKSLGAGSETVTKAQHCRAEVWLEGYGWVPVDPADVRKVMLEEPPRDLSIDDPKVVAAREGLFGAWEGNWVGYNFAHDLKLPGSETGPYPFLMYPEAEIGGRRRDALSPDDFAYTITVRETS